MNWYLYRIEGLRPPPGFSRPPWGKAGNAGVPAGRSEQSTSRPGGAVPPTEPRPQRATDGTAVRPNSVS
jgi:hypothetical protein